MVRPESHPGVGKFLLNPNGRISNCICCCQGLPDTLYFHAEPVNDLPGCEVDQGFEEANPSQTCLVLQRSQIGHCEDWTEGVFNSITLTCASGGDEVPPINWGLTVQAYCIPTNIFMVDVCFDFGGAPSNLDDCREKVTVSVFADIATCNAQPGNFILDLGEFQPTFSTFTCDCKYHFWIDESCSITPTEVNPIYHYPAEGAGGFDFLNLAPGTNKLNTALWFWEFYPDIGTPLHWTVESTILNSEYLEMPSDLKELFEKSWQLAQEQS